MPCSLLFFLRLVLMPRRHFDDPPDDEPDDWIEPPDDVDETLDHCPECDAEIYDDAERCPHCGSWLHTDSGDAKAEGALWVILLGFIVAVVVVVLLAS